MIEAYKIGVTLALTNHVSGALAMISRDFRAANVDAERLKRTLGEIKLLAITGAIAMGGGVLGLHALKGPLEEAKKYQTELAKFTALGYGDVVNSQADKFARGLNVMGQSARDNLTLLRETTGIMGDFEHAKEALPMLAKMKFGLESVMGEGQGAKFEQMFQSAIKVAELRGALVNRATGQIDVARFGAVLNQMTQAYVASGGLVKPQDYLAAIKTGGVSAKMMNDEMFFFGLGHFMQESGGSRTGTAAMSMFQNLAMGRVSQQVAERLKSYGLLDPSKLHYGRTGHITKVDPMGIVNAQQFVQNPFQWLNETAVPKLMKLGYKGDNLNLALAQMFGIRTAANLADQMVREQALATRYTERAKHAAGFDQLYQAGGETLAGKQIELHAKWNSLMLELGNTILPIAVPALQKLVDALNLMTGWARGHRALTELLVGTFAAFSLLATVGGGVLLFSAAVKALGAVFGIGGGPVAWVIMGISAAVTGAVYTYQHWEEIKPKLLAIWTGLSDWFDKLISVITKGLEGLWKSVGSTLQKVFPEQPRYDENGRPYPDYVPPAANKKTTIEVPVNLDGRQITKVVAEHMSDEMNKPNTGADTFDGRLGWVVP